MHDQGGLISWVDFCPLYCWVMPLFEWVCRVGGLICFRGIGRMVDWGWSSWRVYRGYHFLLFPFIPGSRLFSSFPTYFIPTWTA